MLTKLISPWRRSISWRRYLPVGLVACAGALLSLAGFAAARYWEWRNVQAEFRRAAEERRSSVCSTFESRYTVLGLTRAALAGAIQLDRRGFHELLAPFLRQNPSVQAIQWVPRVAEAERTEFEARVRRDGTADFAVKQLDAAGRLIVAAERKEYFPICFAEPRAENAPVLGFDVASEPQRRQALVRARDSGQAVITGLVRFIGVAGKQYGFVVFVPVYHRGAAIDDDAARRANLRGFVVAIFRPDEMIENALAHLKPEGIDVWLRDDSAPEDQNILHFHTSREDDSDMPGYAADMDGTGGLLSSSSLNVAGHRWSVICAPTPRFLKAHRSLWPWAALVNGLLLTALLTAYLVRSLGQAARTESLLNENRQYSCRLEERVTDQTVAIRRAQEETIFRLVSASLCRDEETGMHIRRTGLLSEVIARAAGWSNSEAELIRMAAPMHDVGKIGIPDAVLRKQGKLTEEEFAVMRTHTTIGARMLAGSEVPMLRMAQEIAQNHHEWWNGAGYPRGLQGEAIPESARIVAIVDAYDALTHDRVYRPAVPEDQVLDMLRADGGTHFDPYLLAVFFAHLDEIRRISAEHPNQVAAEPGQLLVWPVTAPEAIVAPV